MVTAPKSFISCALPVIRHDRNNKTNCNRSKDVLTGYSSRDRVEQDGHGGEWSGPVDVRTRVLYPNGYPSEACCHGAPMLSAKIFLANTFVCQ